MAYRGRVAVKVSMLRQGRRSASAEQAGERLGPRRARPGGGPGAMIREILDMATAYRMAMAWSI